MYLITFFIIFTITWIISLIVRWRHYKTQITGEITWWLTSLIEKNEEFSNYLQTTDFKFFIDQVTDTGESEVKLHLNLLFDKYNILNEYLDLRLYFSYIYPRLILILFKRVLINKIISLDKRYHIWENIDYSFLKNIELKYEILLLIIYYQSLLPIIKN